MRPFPNLRALGAALALALAAPAAAQDLNYAALRPEQPHLLHAGVGVEDAAVASLGYAYLLPMLGRTFALTSMVDVVPVHAADWRLRTGLAAPLASWGGWTAGAAEDPAADDPGAGAKVLGIARGAKNEVNRMTNLGLETSATGGYYSPRWFVAAEAGVDWAAATYIAHTERYRTLVYSGARDGWYSTTGATLVYGLAGGYSFRDVDLVARAGQRRDLQLSAGMIPFSAGLAVEVRLPLSR